MTEELGAEGCVVTKRALYFPFFLIEFIGVSLVNKMIEGPGMQSYNTSSVYCIGGSPPRANQEGHFNLRNSLRQNSATSKDRVWGAMGWYFLQGSEIKYFHFAQELVRS